VWGNKLKPADLEALENKLVNGLKNQNPKTVLAHALKQKKTIRFGNKTDPFQLIERTHKTSKKILSILIRLEWTFVIQTKFTHVMMDYEKRLLRANRKNLITVMPVMSPGLEKDWEMFERRQSTPPIDRLKHAAYLQYKGVPVGFNGEPFIPGFHTVNDFENTLKLLKEYKIKSYNTYNFHFNPYVAKRLHAIDIDIEKIWFYNQDDQWKKILPKLLKLSKKYNIILGNPDFVNTGKNWVEQANTCCGVNVPNPCTFNSHYFKKYKQLGLNDKSIFTKCYDGTGDPEQGSQIITGECKDMYNLKDAGF
jgi:DNA repair photolyase